MDHGQAGELEPTSEQALTHQLLSERGKRLRIVGHRPLVAALRIAVRDALQSQLGIQDAHATQAVVSFAETRLLGQLRQSGRQGRGFSKGELFDVMDAVRKHYLETQARVRSQIGQLEAELEERRGALRHEEEALLLELDRLGDPSRHPLSGRIRALLTHSSLSQAESAELVEQLLPLVFQELQSERRKGMDVQLGQHHREIDVLQRRIAKLAESLQASEANLRRVSKMHRLDPGLASIYREVQGLSEDDSFAETKREMLAKIFEANLDLQEELDRRAAR